MLLWRTLTNLANSIFRSNSCRVPVFVNTGLLEYRPNTVDLGGSCLLAFTVQTWCPQDSDFFYLSFVESICWPLTFWLRITFVFLSSFSGMLMFERGSCYILQIIREFLILLLSSHECEKYRSVPPHPA